MQDALSVRHRITHPKKPEDLEITDQVLYSISEGHRWLFNCLVGILTRTRTMLTRRLTPNLRAAEPARRGIFVLSIGHLGGPVR